jgi:hypothetical protein
MVPKRLYVVQAEKDGELTFWAAATAPENATRAVLDHLGPGWQATLTKRVLSRTYSELLEVPPGKVRRIRYMKRD